ncbi:MAG TPA: hypothetical protein V6D09_26220 [Leptolyngbyaceae cyanobacterium]
MSGTIKLHYPLLKLEAITLKILALQAMDGAIAIYPDNKLLLPCHRFAQTGVSLAVNRLELKFATPTR